MAAVLEVMVFDLAILVSTIENTVDSSAVFFFFSYPP
jgi:hypothetical protein